MASLIHSKGFVVVDGLRFDRVCGVTTAPTPGGCVDSTVELDDADAVYTGVWPVSSAVCSRNRICISRILLYIIFSFEVARTDP